MGACTDDAARANISSKDRLPQLLRDLPVSQLSYSIHGVICCFRCSADKPCNVFQFGVCGPPSPATRRPCPATYFADSLATSALLTRFC